jgi:nucleoside-diphosphate-sugar epimerase
MAATRQVVLFGAGGQLGSALARRLPTAKHASWRAPALPDGPLDIVIANGLTDPKADAAALAAANVAFPQHIAAMAAGRDARLLTLGSVMEKFPEACRANAYLAGKEELARWMAARTPAGRCCHLRLHTVFGGPPHPHMFLGQMVQALAAGRTFRMSSGEQLREYHHADDIAGSIAALLSRPWDKAIVEVSHGQPLRLAALARAVFAALGRTELLEIGAVAAAPGENRERTFPRSPDWLIGRPRETLPAVIDWVRACVADRRG